MSYYFNELTKLGRLNEQQARGLLEIFGERGLSPATGASDRPATKRPFIRLAGEFCELEQRHLPASWKRANARHLRAFGFRWAKTPHGEGIFVPITEKFRPVYFTLRLRHGGYLAASALEASHRKSECLFGVDFVPDGASRCLIVESAHDAVGASVEYRLPAVALLGSSISREQALLLAEKRVGLCLVALDRDALHLSGAVGAELDSVGLNFVVGTWTGGKDWSEGGKLKFL